MKKNYVKPLTADIHVGTVYSILTGSVVEENSTVNFEDLTDGGDFAW